MDCKQIRREMKLSQRSMAKILGFGRTKLCRIEKGQWALTEKEKEKLAQAYKTRTMKIIEHQEMILPRGANG